MTDIFERNEAETRAKNKTILADVERSRAEWSAKGLHVSASELQQAQKEAQIRMARNAIERQIAPNRWPAEEAPPARVVNEPVTNSSDFRSMRCHRNFVPSEAARAALKRQASETLEVLSSLGETELAPQDWNALSEGVALAHAAALRLQRSARGRQSVAHASRPTAWDASPKASGDRDEAKREAQMKQEAELEKARETLLRVTGTNEPKEVK